MDLVVFGCTSGSCIKGANWDKECIRRIENACNIPGLTTSTAVLESLNALGARSLAVLTPYPDATNEAERKFLEDNGFEVRTILGMDMSGVEKGRIYNAEKPFLYRNSVKMDLKGADVFFLSCMALDTLGLVGDLETDLGIPVVTSHQATLWSALRHCGIKTRQPHLGKLFAI